MSFLFRSLRRLGGYSRLESVVRRGGFTLIELLTVMTIIAILAGLILSIAGYANKQGALSRARAEIQAISAACESYKADNGTYPHQPLPTSGTSIPSDLLYPGGATPDGNSLSNQTLYTQASLELYEALTSDTSANGFASGPPPTGSKNYIADLKPDVWGRSNPTAAVSSSNPVLYLSDPFGNVYGYSTAYATTGTNGYNPTFDLWSTGGQTSTPNPPSSSGSAGDPMLQWVRNW